MTVPFATALLLERRGRSEFKFKQRRLVIKKRLIKTRKRFASRANRVQQFQRRALTGSQRNLCLALNVIDLCDDAGPIKFNSTLLDLESNQGFVYIAYYLIGDQPLLIFRFLFFDERFSALSLIAIRHRQRNAKSESVSAGPRGNLIDAGPYRQVRNAQRVLQPNVCFG